MRICSALSIVVLSAASVLPVSATILHVAQSGTFGSATTTTDFSVSNGSFTFGYDVDSTPAITGFSTGTFFETKVANFSYTLNGTSIPATNPGAIFFSIGQGGLMSICFNYPCLAESVFVLQGPQIYSGSELAPTILEGVYTPTSARFGEDFLASASDVIITEAPAAITPEPSSLVFLGTGILAAAGAMKRRHA